MNNKDLVIDVFNSDHEVRSIKKDGTAVCYGVIMPNSVSRNEPSIQAKRWVDESILRCPFNYCRQSYAKGGTFSFKTHLL
jgi:hypothetical protein